LRRISQIFFLLLFLALLLFTSISFFPSGATEVKLRAPVGLFFEWDPLVALVNALASHALYRGLIWCLLILVPTLFLGRFFCGWICPMGTLQHFVGNMPSESKRGKQRIESNRYKRWQTGKYVVLIAGLVAACFGSAAIGWLDPFSLLVRSFGLSILPAFNAAAGAVLTPLETSHVAIIKVTGQTLHTILHYTVLDLRQPHYAQGLVLGVLFIAILAASLRITRLWCRSICPLGALLGAVSRWSILGLHKDEATCNKCNKCLMHCQGGDDPIGGAPWHKAECLMCMNCVGSCPHDSLNFRFFRNEQEVATPDIGRRKALTGIAAGAAIVPLMRANTGLGKSRHERLLRPPGSLDEKDFLSRCIRCGECMKVCPNTALHPTLEQAGLEGLWTPTLVPRIGYCEPSCVLCSEVCPTGAIWQITPKEKGWVVGTTQSQPIRLGTAFYDRGRCLPWAMATECIVCEEWCPVSPKAIYVQEAEVIDSGGNKKILKQPRIDPSRCVGCGACEYACPLQEHPAVYVTSIGESRSPSSQILLARAAVAAPALGAASQPQPVGEAAVAPTTAPTAAPAQETKTAKSNPFPASGAVPGWQKSGETRTFSASNLYEYIDGGAEEYISAGVVSTSTTDYKYQDKLEATVDVYTMGDAAGARKILDKGQAKDAKKIKLGDAGIALAQSVTFRKGPYLVRIVAFDATPDAPQALLALAHGVEAKL
jgi:polyferredoxin/ferredoxin